MGSLPRTDQPIRLDVGDTIKVAGQWGTIVDRQGPSLLVAEDRDDPHAAVVECQPRDVSAIRIGGEIIERRFL